MSSLFAVVGLVVIFGLVGCHAISCPNITGQKQYQLPQLDPKKFHYNTEITLNDFNQTLDAYEYFDTMSNLTFLYLDQKTNRFKISYDFNYKQMFIVDELTEACSVHELNQAQGSISLIGMGVEGGPMNIKNAFVWNSGYNATDKSVEVVDGIRTDHYKLCMEFNGNVTYDIDVYFSQDDWSMPAGQNAPIMLKLNASTEVDNETVSKQYTYKFYDYHDSSSKDMWTPKLPGGIVCAGRKDAPPNPIATVSQFSAGMTVITGSYTRYVQQYVDLTNELMRTDMSADVFGNPRSQIIHNFMDGLQYTIYPDTGKCDIQPIPLHSAFEDTVVVNKSVKMVAPYSILNLQNASYGGVTEFAGFSAHAWIGDTVAMDKDYYHNGSAAWVKPTLYTSATKYNNEVVTVGMSEVYTSLQKNGTVNMTYNFEFHFYNFVTTTLGPDTFQATACFNGSQQEEVILKFEDSLLDIIKKSPANFTASMVSAVVDAAQVLKTRVVWSASYSIVTEMDPTTKKNKTFVYVAVPILGVPDVKGDSVDMVPQISLADAVANVRNKVQSSEFILKPAEIGAVPDYFSTQHTLLTGQAPAPPPAPPAKAGLSTGVVVGVSIAMLVVGIMLGCFFMIYRNRRANNQYAYTMQD